jgi:hypothetical protein
MKIINSTPREICKVATNDLQPWPKRISLPRQRTVDAYSLAPAGFLMPAGHTTDPVGTARRLISASLRCVLVSSLP